jgi:hypothetical protein
MDIRKPLKRAGSTGTGGIRVGKILSVSEARMMWRIYLENGIVLNALQREIA